MLLHSTIPTGTRVAVVGAKASLGADSFSWGSGSFPNVTDYDAAILDLRSLAKNPAGVKLRSLQAFQGLLGRLLDSGGQVVAIADDPSVTIAIFREDGKQVSVSCEEVLPVSLSVQREGGTRIAKYSTKFDRYTAQIKRWKFHFAFLGRKGRVQTAGYTLTPEAYLQNRESKILAGELKCTSGGRFVLLPNADFDDPQAAVDAVLEEILGTPAATLPPEWADQISIPGMADIDVETARLREQIAELAARADILASQRTALSQYRRLVYAEGPELETIVARALTELGGRIVPRKYGTEEYVLVHNAREHLIEVKGASSSAALKHVRQLLDNLLAAEEKTGRPSHGILIANTWRTRPLYERGIGDLVDFPPNVVDRASANSIALMTGHTLLKAISAKLSGAISGSSVLDKLASVGIIEL